MQPQVFPVGVLLGGTDLDDNLARFAADGAEIVQIWCTRGELAPDGFDAGVASRVLRRCELLGLRISALCGDTGLGFTNPDRVQEAFDRTVSYFHVCRELGVRVLTSHIGRFTDETARRTALDWLRRLGDEAGRLGVTFASETGAEDGPALRDFLDELAHPRIAVNLDPANMLMRGFDLERAVRLLGPYIAHGHAKDARFEGGEAPIGAGDVPWPRYLRWLAATGYTGALAIEREGGDAFRDDVRQGMALLRHWRASL